MFVIFEVLFTFQNNTESALEKKIVVENWLATHDEKKIPKKNVCKQTIMESKEGNNNKRNWLANLSLSSLRSLSSDSPSAAILRALCLSLFVASLRNNVRLFQLDFQFQFLLTFAFACDLFDAGFALLYFASF